MSTQASEANPPDRSLVIRCQGGDLQAFGMLVSRYMRRAYFGALGLVGSHDDAVDLSQEAFVRAFHARGDIEASRPFYPWLYQILRRLCFNFLRDAKTRAARLATESPWIVADRAAVAARHDAHRMVEREEVRKRLEEALADLGVNEREVFVLKEFEALKYREIAELLDIPIGTVMSRLYAARRALADRLEDLR